MRGCKPGRPYGVVSVSLSLSFLLVGTSPPRPNGQRRPQCDSYRPLYSPKRAAENSECASELIQGRLSASKPHPNFTFEMIFELNCKNRLPSCRLVCDGVKTLRVSILLFQLWCYLPGFSQACMLKNNHTSQLQPTTPHITEISAEDKAI